MSLTRAQLISSLAAKITDNTNKENTAARVRAIIEEIINNAPNLQDDGITPTKEVDLVVTPIDPPPFGPPLFRADGDAALGKSFFLMVSEIGGTRLYPPVNLKEGEVYTFIFEQAADTGAVYLGPNFVSQLGFTMVAGNGNKSMFQAYCHQDTDLNFRLYCFPQQDFS